MCVPSKTLSSTLKGCNWRYLVFQRTERDWVQECCQHSRCHSTCLKNTAPIFLEIFLILFRRILNQTATHAQKGVKCPLRVCTWHESSICLLLSCPCHFWCKLFSLNNFSTEMYFPIPIAYSKFLLSIIYRLLNICILLCYILSKFLINAIDKLMLFFLFQPCARLQAAAFGNLWMLIFFIVIYCFPLAHLSFFWHLSVLLFSCRCTFLLLQYAAVGVLILLQVAMPLLVSAQTFPKFACGVLVSSYLWNSYISFTKRYHVLAAARFEQKDQLKIGTRKNW